MEQAKEEVREEIKSAPPKFLMRSTKSGRKPPRLPNRSKRDNKSPPPKEEQEDPDIINLEMNKDMNLLDKSGSILRQPQSYVPYQEKLLIKRR